MREENGLVIYEVSEFVDYLNDTLVSIVDQNRIAVEGEVSSFNISQGKWVRFDLKDADALMSCFLGIYNLRVELEDGMKARVYGYPKIYAKYGKLSLQVQRIELVGEGALRRAYELLKIKLEKEGFFAAARKRPLPRFPERVGLITSREAAACGDFLRLAGNRWGGAKIELVHVQVQGEPAPAQIAAAFRYFNRLESPPEVVVLIRGGGSLEDLAAFNSELVARAIFSSKVPVVVGVGHERDESIADFVADRRASTPSNAAELVFPDRREISYAVGAMSEGLTRSLEAAVLSRKNRLDRETARLEHRLAAAIHRVESVVQRFRGAFREYCATLKSRRRDAALAGTKLIGGCVRLVRRFAAQIETSERILKTLDPRAMLRRGYAVVRNRAGELVRRPEDVDLKDRLTVQLHGGGLSVEVLDKLKQQGTLPL